MKANYVDIICKYLTWYKDVRVEVEHESVFGLPVLRVYDDILGNCFTIYSVDQITRTFRDIGSWRWACLGNCKY